MITVGNKSSFVKQASVLAAAGIISRVIGFVYRPPLTALIGDEGMGIYSLGYQVYNLLIILSSAGLPVAISKMVSERLAFKDYAGAHKVFKTALAAAFCAGLFCSLLLLVFARRITMFMGLADSYHALLALAPTLTIVAVMAVYRGYFQGMGNSMPTALSQVLEQVFHAVFSVFLAWYFMRAFENIAYGAAGGTAGTGIGALVGLVVMLIIYRLSYPVIVSNIRKTSGLKPGADFSQKQAVGSRIREINTSSVLKELALTALPIIAGTAIFSFTNLIDSAMVMRRLQEYLSENEAKALYGQLSNKYVSISTLPVSISSAIATASIPSLAASRVLRNKRETYSKMNTAMRLSMMISFPAAVGIGVFSSQILLFLFPSYPEGGELLRTGAISIIFLALYQISTGMLQGMDRIRIPVLSVFCGVIVKIPLNYYLLGIPEINVQATVISTIVCYIIASAVNVGMLIRLTKVRLDFAGILIKPAFASLVMGMFCFVAYYLMYYIYPSNTLCLMAAILAGCLFYFMVMLFTKAVKANDVTMMPFGGKITALLKRLRLGGFLVKETFETYFS